MMLNVFDLRAIYKLERYVIKERRATYLKYLSHLTRLSMRSTIYLVIKQR